MNIKNELSLDEIGLKILNELQNNGRSTYSELGRKVGLSSPAIAERVYKMEEAGIIRGYHCDIDMNILGYTLMALISLTTSPERYKNFYAYAENQNEILECHHISGNESFIIKVLAQSVAHLDALVEELSRFGETKTSIVLSTPVDKKRIKPIS